MDDLAQWTRSEAEDRIRDVFDRAKSGVPQLVLDNDGVIEIRFLPATSPNTTAGEFLARGGPLDE